MVVGREGQRVPAVLDQSRLADITTRLEHEVKGWLDDTAWPQMANLRNAYDTSGSGITPLVTPVTAASPIPGAGTGDGISLPDAGATSGPADTGGPGGLPDAGGPGGQWQRRRPVLPTDDGWHGWRRRRGEAAGAGAADLAV